MIYHAALRHQPGFGSKMAQPRPFNWGKAYIFCQRNAMTKPDGSFTIESHFEGKDSVRRIYDRLLKLARRFGPVIEDPKKTSIHLVNKTAFAGVTTRKSAIILTIKSDRKL